MSRRYTYSRTIKTVDGDETFSAVEFDSFDEAQRAVAKGISDRLLELKQKHGAKDVPHLTGMQPVPMPNAATAGSTPSTNPTP